MTDFETHPIGTAAELERLRGRVARLELILDEALVRREADGICWYDHEVEALRSELRAGSPNATPKHQS